MDLDIGSRYPMRILIRHQKTGLYLQPSGEWTANRDRARTFASSTVAFWWAKEQQILHTEILMAFTDPQFDFVSMRT